MRSTMLLGCMLAVCAGGCAKNDYLATCRFLSCCADRVLPEPPGETSFFPTNVPDVKVVTPREGDAFELVATQQLAQALGNLALGDGPDAALVIGGAESARTRKLLLTALEDPELPPLNKRRIIFVGDPEDADACRPAVEAHGGVLIVAKPTWLCLL